MTMCELATIAQERLDINVAIINNGYLGMVRQWQEFFYERRYAATPITGPDFVKLADAFGPWGDRRDARARRRRGRGRAARGARGPPSSTSASSRKTRCIRWCRPAPICTR